MKTKSPPRINVLAPVVWAAACCGLLTAAPSHAAPDYPTRAITYVVPNASGGSGDVIARVLSEKLNQDLGQPIVVENKAGATGTIGAGLVARAQPDGYTLLVSSTGPMAIVPALRPALPYNATTAFTPIVKIADSHTVLVVAADKPWNSVQDIIRAAKAAPGTLSFASGGNGTVLHLQGELFKLRTGTSLIHVPFKGDAPAVTELMSGRVSMMFVPTQAVDAYVRSGHLKVIAVTSGKRLKRFPAAPTMAESGVADFVSDAWFGAYVPAKTPPAIVARLNAAFNRALKDPKVIARLDELGLEVVGGAPQALADAQRIDTERWAKVVKSADLHLTE